MSDITLNTELKERFEQLPKVVQSAILSADVQKHLQELANNHKLHVDQWQLLENNVMLTLLGFQPIDELAKNIKDDIGLREEQAQAMAADISKAVFEPIRHEMERELEHPEAKKEVAGGVEQVRSTVLGATPKAPEPAAKPEPTPAKPTLAPVNEKPAPTPPTPSAPAQPATPPAPAPEKKATRPAATPSGMNAGAYKMGEKSTERKAVVDDPYREPPT